MKGPRFSQVLGLNELKSSLKVKIFVSSKFFCITVFTKGDLVETFVLDLSLGLNLNFHMTTVVLIVLWHDLNT